MNCCKTNLSAPKGLANGVCSACGIPASRLSIRTLFHQMNPSTLQMIRDQEYWFCNNEQCNVVYFGKDGATFSKDDLRERIWIKNRNELDLPVCNCFGYSAARVLNPVFTTSRKASEEIRDYIGRGLCECEIRNPSGKCCLGIVLHLEKEGVSKEE